MKKPDKLSLGSIIIPEIKGKSQLIEVEWVDADSDANVWRPGEKLEQGMLLIDIGYLVGESDQFLTIAMEIWLRRDKAIGNFRRVLNIPKVAIVNRRILK